MVEICAQSGVRFGEAFMYRFDARYKRISELLASGELGAVRFIHGYFSYKKVGDKGNIRFQSEMGGGAIYDVGCYPLHAARTIIGQEPHAVTVNAYFDPEYNGVDTSSCGLVEFANGVSATFDCAMTAEGRNRLEIVCEHGRIELPNAFNTGAEASLTLIMNGTPQEERFTIINPYLVQFEQFSLGVAGQAPFPFEGSDAIRNMALVDACYRSARERNRIEL
jgi:predicted dehydrogenase